MKREMNCNVCRFYSMQKNLLNKQSLTDTIVKDKQREHDFRLHNGIASNF